MIVRDLAVSLTALLACAACGFAGQAEPASPAAPAAPVKKPSATPGRPVRVVSLCFRGGSKSVEQVRQWIDREGKLGADLIALPETWRGTKLDTPDSPAVRAVRELARKHRTYIVCPIYRSHAGKRYNSALLIDRTGKIAFTYDKVYPYWGEFHIQPTTEIGKTVAVHKADFGRVGIAICFDVNFPGVWQRLADQGAEVVIWPSAYSAGRQLMAHALNHHYYIVTATFTKDCQVYDITGERIVDKQVSDGEAVRVTLDLDRGIYHANFNKGKLRLMQEHYRDSFTVERMLYREQWFVLKSAKPGVQVRPLARRHGLEELRAYKARSRHAIDKKRGPALQPSARRARRDVPSKLGG